MSHTTVTYWQAPMVCFSALKARVRSLAAEGSQMEDLKTCLREYCFSQRAINGRNRVPKATFEHILRIYVNEVSRFCKITLKVAYPR